MATPTNNTAVKVEPYLFFEGTCDEAIQFYQRTLGATVQGIMRFKDSPEPSMCPPGMNDKVMHANIKIGETTVMASDGRCSGQRSFGGFALSITAPTEAQAEQWFAALSEGGQVQMPMTKTFFSPRFGMVADRFGVSWMVLVTPTM